MFTMNSKLIVVLPVAAVIAVLFVGVFATPGTFAGGR